MDRRRPDYDDNRVVREYRAWIVMLTVFATVTVVFAIAGELLAPSGTEAEQPVAP